MESRKNWIIRIAQCWFVRFLVFCTLFHSPKVKPWFVQDITMAAGFGDVHQYLGWLIFMYLKSGLTFYWGRGSVYEKRRTNDFPSKFDLQVALYASQNFQFLTNCWKTLFECLTSQTGVITNRYICLSPYIWQYNTRQYTRRFLLIEEQIFVFTVSTYFVSEKFVSKYQTKYLYLMLWNVFTSIGRSILLLNFKLIFWTFYRDRGQQLY